MKAHAILAAVQSVLLALGGFAVASSASAQSAAFNNRDCKDEKTRRTPFSLNERLTPHQGVDFETPEGQTLFITDIVLQNRDQSDTPVLETMHSRFTLGPMISNAGTERRQTDMTLTVVGNDTVNLHFTTGLEAYRLFRIINVGNSTALLVEAAISDYLIADCKPKQW